MEHLLETDEGRPSMVELLAQEQLKGLLRPSILYILRWLRVSHLKYFDEVYLIGDLLLEGYLLVKHDGTLCENYYGIKRSNLKIIQLIASLIETCIIPYLAIKFEDHLERALGLLNGGWKSLYCLGFISSWTPLQAITKIGYERSNSEGGIQRILGDCMFILRIVNWWTDQMDSIKAKPQTERRLTPNPKQLFPPKQPYHPGSCPLCGLPSRLALMTGIVYCQECITKHWQLHGHTCPVTETVLPPSHRGVLLR